MRQQIQQITEQLVDRLPENDQYYRLDELHSWEFPPFIVRRISVELKRNLSDSMRIPQTDWANTRADSVLDAWQQFIDAIRDEARLPASFAKGVIETAVAEVLEMLVRPRKNVPEVVFGAEDELSAEKVRERLEGIVVYRHFAILISKYLQKKELNTLSKKRCAEIIAKADQKLTSGYSPLNWAQMLEPLFQLLGDEIDSNLLRLFFEDKKMPRVARKFDLMNDTLSRAEFIEALSSPDLLDFEGYEDDQSSLFNESSEDESTPPSGKDRTAEERNTENDDERRDTEDKQQDDPDVPFNIERASDQDEEPEEADSMNSGFAEELEKKRPSPNSNGIENEGKIESEEDKTSRAELGQKGAKKKSTDTKDALSASAKEEEKPSSAETQEEEKSSATSQKDSEEEETPMWMRYMSEEEIEEYKKEQEREDEAVDDEGFIEEPIIDLTQEDASDEEIDKLLDQLESDRSFFVEEIFRGSDRAFDQAIEDIAGYDSWRDVSKYIEKDVFKRNLVDMYSEAAVDFTDRLQNYFLEKQNRN